MLPTLAQYSVERIFTYDVNHTPQPVPDPVYQTRAKTQIATITEDALSVHIMAQKREADELILDDPLITD